MLTISYLDLPQPLHLHTEARVIQPRWPPLPQRKNLVKGRAGSPSGIPSLAGKMGKGSCHLPRSSPMEASVWESLRLWQCQGTLKVISLSRWHPRDAVENDSIGKKSRQRLAFSTQPPAFSQLAWVLLSFQATASLSPPPPPAACRPQPRPQPSPAQPDSPSHPHHPATPEGFVSTTRFKCLISP